MNGAFLEDVVSRDIEGFLRDPGEVLEALRQRLNSEQQTDSAGKKAAALSALLAEKARERDRMLVLYRRGRIGDDALDGQLKEIESEEQGIRAQLAEVEQRADRVQQQTSSLATVEALLKQLRARVEAGLSWEVKRQLVEILVEGITVNTINEAGKRQATIAVRYRFNDSVETCTGTHSCNKTA